MPDRNKIDELIEKEKPSSFFWHFLSGTWYKGFVFGQKISVKEYIIWTSDFLTGTSHPIFIIKFDENGNIKEMKSEKNPFEKISAKVLIPLAVVFLIFFSYVNFKENGDVLESFLIFLFFGSIFSLVLFFGKKHYAKQEQYLANELYKTIEKMSLKRSNNKI